MPAQRIAEPRDFPSVEELLQSGELAPLLLELPRPIVAVHVKAAVSDLKGSLSRRKTPLVYSQLIEDILARLQPHRVGRLARVINATGVVVHTNLGRAPLSDALFEAMKTTVTGYGNVEFDVASGKRGKRGEACEIYLRELSGAEAGTVVNNCAAALFIILNTLANRKKVIISRGELVQIGGGFRIPDILTRSRARLCEVGTTNITTLKDYEAALDDQTALILKVHKSNFRQTGFTEETPLADLTRLGARYNVPVVNDLGSGVFVATRKLLGYAEPTVQDSVRAGAALTCFSGDKMLGGMQAGLMVGREDLVRKVKKNPIFRTVRVDKVVFSVLEKLLMIYLNGTHEDDIRLWQILALRPQELRKRANLILKALGDPAGVKVENTSSFVGGGALPEQPIPSVGLIFSSAYRAEPLMKALRNCRPPIIGRIDDDRFILDLRTVDPADSAYLAESVKKVIAR